MVAEYMYILHRISILIRDDDCTINLEILSLWCLFLFPFRDAEHKNLMNWIKLNCEGENSRACWRRTNWLFSDGNSRWCHEFQAPASTGHTWLHCYCAPLVLIETWKWIFCGKRREYGLLSMLILLSQIVKCCSWYELKMQFLSQFWKITALIAVNDNSCWDGRFMFAVFCFQKCTLEGNQAIKPTQTNVLHF